jgi:UDP-N-acetylglucosamine 2-epimerase
MPEEVNRVVADHLATYLLCPTENAIELLRREGVERGVYFTGDLMFDALVATLPIAREQAPRILERQHLEADGYYLATVHRAANTDDAGTLARILEALGRLDLPVVLPLHPRTRGVIEANGIATAANLRLIDPVGYLEMLALEQAAKAILTDSGGVPREAYFLSVPCVTLREETEWPETLVDGWNVLAGSDIDLIVSAAHRPRPSSAPLPAFGDGRAASKIVEILERDPSHSRR